TQLGKQALADGVAEAPDIPTLKTIEDGRVDVLEVDMGHPCAELPQCRDRVAAAHEVVPDVETEGQRIGIDRNGQPIDFGGRLDVGPGMRVKRDPGAGPPRL